MAAATYLDNSYAGTTKTVRRRRKPAAKAVAAKRTRTAPWWLSAVIFTAIFGMLLVSINYRAFTEMRDEASQNATLQTRVQSLMDENLQLQEEIHGLKTDPNVISREARRIGVSLEARR
jgi:cell division protein FtsB